MNVRPDIAELLHAGYGDRTIARQLSLTRYQITQARQALGLPPVGFGPKPAGSVEDLFWRRTSTLPGGHMQWTGHRNNYGTPALKHGGRQAGRTYSAYQVAFRIKYGRDAEGTVSATCEHPGCVAPAHMADQPMRERVDSLYTAIFGEVAA